MSRRRHASRSRPIRLFFAFCAAALLLPAHAQHQRGDRQGGAVGPSEGWHGTPGLQGQGTPGLEWHGTPGLQGGGNWNGGQGAQQWRGGPDRHDEGRHFDRHDDGHHFDRQGDGRRLDRHDGGAWRGGHWQRGPTWYYYPAPIYPYPDPAFSPQYAPGPAQYVFYCPSFAAYYPQVTACPGGWIQVLAPP